MERTRGRKIDSVPMAQEPGAETVVRPKSDEIRWINTGGPFYMKSRRKIAHNETFVASPSEVPVAFRDTIRPADPVAATQMTPITPAMAGYRIQQRGATEYYDIIDAKGKRISNKDLTFDEVKAVMDALG